MGKKFRVDNQEYREDACTVVFRVDASIDIGTGHVMRCLTLAHTLAVRGECCHFICRKLPGHLCDVVESRGFKVHRLDYYDNSDEHHGHCESTLDYEKWLGTTWQRDAYECGEIIFSLHPTWVVVDHYALDIRWESAVVPEYARLLVVDDLADRQHGADLLLDQNLGRTEKDYNGKTPIDCQLLIGPNYTLLRDEFALYRESSLENQKKRENVENLLISMGGVDRDNVTRRVLECIEHCFFSNDLRVTVVMGATAPWLGDIEAAALHSRFDVEVATNVTDMARLMAGSDIAIGAAGSTSWERCCLGLPTVMIAVADNQLEAGSALERAGAAIFIDNIGSIESKLIDAIKLLCDSSVRSKISSDAAKITDGRGALRVCDHMIKH